jgi:hypothetical protein
MMRQSVQFAIDVTLKQASVCKAACPDVVNATRCISDLMRKSYKNQKI